MRLSLFSILCCSALLFTGCPDDDDGDVGMDIGPKDATDTGVGMDALPDTGQDTGTPDTGEEMDGGGMDANDTGMQMPGVTMLPGVGVEIQSSRVDIGVDTFDTVNAKFPAIPRVRMPLDSVRSYEYTFPNYTVTIWYANTNLDDDGMAPMDVDGTDVVLWIAVEDGFPGTTPDGLSLDSNRADVEGVYGAAPHMVDIANPMGTLAQYYAEGILVAYEPNDDVRTITISKAYGVEPNGEIDVPGRRIVFGGDEIMGSLVDIPPELGTERNTVTNLLGPPDTEGTIMLGGQMVDALSYGFLGIEVFFAEGGQRTVFLVIHPPYYGMTADGLGMGTTRADMEMYLVDDLGYTATPSTNPQFICYDDPGTGPAADLGVTYTMTDNLVSSISLALPSCP